MDDCLEAAEGAARDLRLAPGAQREDAVSDVALELFQHVGSKSGIASPKSYLFISARRRMCSWLRREARRGLPDQRHLRKPLSSNFPSRPGIIVGAEDRQRVHNYLAGAERAAAGWEGEHVSAVAATIRAIRRSLTMS